jgi:hypothetical protein
MAELRRLLPVLRLITDVEVAASAIERWRNQYAHWTDDNRFSDGKTKGEVSAALDAGASTPDGITKTLNAGWAHPRCDVCSQLATVVAEAGGEFGGRSISCCLSCAEHIAALLRQFPRASEGVEPNFRNQSPI